MARPVQTLGQHRRLSKLGDSDDEDGLPLHGKTVLTVAKASDLCPKPFRLIGRKQALTSLHDLSALRQLDYVDLSNNALTSVAGLSGCIRLKTVMLQGNRLASADGLLGLSNVRILNLSDNPLPSLEWLRSAAFASKLLTLVLTSADITSLDGIRALSEARTLILSRNRIEDLSSISSLHKLEKLSVSHNDVRALPVGFAGLEKLQELRVAHNKLNKLPEDVMAGMTGLKILDVGHNRLDGLHALKLCKKLVNVNVRGNAVDKEGGDEATFVKKICPGVEVVDGMRVAGGRRKERINRLRVAAGMQVEEDRKFARAPPTEVVRKLVEGGEDGSLDVAAKKEAMRVLRKESKKAEERDQKERDAEGKKAVQEEEGTMEMVGEKRKRRDEEAGTAGGEGDDDEVDAEAFLEQARTLALSKGVNDTKVKKFDRKKKLRKRSKGVGQRVGQRSDFGGGGDSKW